MYEELSNRKSYVALGVLEDVPLPTMAPLVWFDVGQVPGYSTRRLQGLDVAPSDAKAMMRAKANKARASFGAGAGAGPANAKASAGEGETIAPGNVVPKGFEAANRVVAAATRC